MKKYQLPIMIILLVITAIMAGLSKEVKVRLETVSSINMIAGENSETAKVVLSPKIFNLPGEGETIIHKISILSLVLLLAGFSVFGFGLIGYAIKRFYRQ
jgi:hypothetical protein